MVGDTITILVMWNMIGAVLMLIMTVGVSSPGTFANILSPIWIYDRWRLNYFGVVLVCILLNLLCPIWTICVWTVKSLKFICTVGRR